MKLAKRTALLAIWLYAAFSIHAQNLYGTPGQSQTIPFRVVDVYGAGVSGASVTFGVYPAATNSGYHYHNPTGRPRPTLILPSGVTDSGGYTHTIVKWPLYSGTYKVSATCTQTVNVTVIQTVQVETTEAIEMSPSTGVTLFPDPNHTSYGFQFAHAADAWTANRIATIGRAYVSRGGSSFPVVRGALPWGGILDSVPSEYPWISPSSDPHSKPVQVDVAPPLTITLQQALAAAIHGTPALPSGTCEYMPMSFGYWHIWCE